ncbi:MAG: hypothetical protein HY695_32415 [Deltaproteobacteria bacterium]|nr:hypothetical protein [Deltaproteobacteria bacterium]
MNLIKMDDPRLDESFSFLFAFQKGDVVARKNEPSVRGEIRDGVHLGEFPKPAAASINRGGKTLYEIKVSDGISYILDETEIEKVSSP